MDRRLTLVALVALFGAVPVSAQIPGDELPSIQRARQEYLNLTYGEIRDRVTEWTELMRKADTRRLGRMFTEDGLYSPAEGWYVQGRDAVVDSLTTRLARTRGYHLTFLDFAASGNLAYYLGRLRYSLDHGETPREVEGTFVMLLYLEGRTWRVRSYVERTGD
jgi:ketosteroid isomerase-like protein